jgi:hypothetical protein
MNNLAKKYLAYQNDCKDCGSESCDESYKDKIIPSNTNERCSNSGFNFGISSNLVYDPEHMVDETIESTGPIQSTMDPNRIKNCSQCLSLNGPRASHNGWGNSIVIDNPGVAPAQQLTDIESILHNLNVKNSRTKKGGVNPVDVFKFEKYDTTLCNRDLDPLDTLQTYPKQLYREMSINRFYDLNKNPQKNIYYSWTENSQLTARDNYETPYPYINNQDDTRPKSIKGKSKKCKTFCKESCDVKVLNRGEQDDSESEDEEYYTDEESSDEER